MQLDDKFLMERVKAGESAAFEQIFNKYERKILNFFYKLCYSQTLSEDLTQETFLRLWRSRRRYNPEIGKFSTYLFQIAKNCWLSHSGTKKFQEEQTRSEPEGFLSPVASFDPANIAEKQEIQEKLREAIGALPEDLRMSFVLSRYENLKYEEIGQVMGISPRTVERKISDAIKLLAKQLTGKKSR